MRHLRAPLREIFLCQCSDQGLSLLFSAALLSIGFGNLNHLAQIRLMQLNSFFWIGFLLFTFSVSLLYRLLAVQLLGKTVGALVLNLKIDRSPDSKTFWVGQVWESAQWIAPALWPLELFLRYYSFPIGNDYALEFKASYHAKATELG